MSRSTTTTPTPAEELELISPTDWGSRCVLCERIWPQAEDTIHHTFVISTVEPVSVCENCESTGQEPRWHAFRNSSVGGPVLGQGVVCPTCVTTKGLDSAVRVAAEAKLREIFTALTDLLGPPVPEA